MLWEEQKPPPEHGHLLGTIEAYKSNCHSFFQLGSVSSLTNRTRRTPGRFPPKTPLGCCPAARLPREPSTARSQGSAASSSRDSPNSAAQQVKDQTQQDFSSVPATGHVFRIPPQNNELDQPELFLVGTGFVYCNYTADRLPLDRTAQVARSQVAVPSREVQAVLT